jgi:hypothetical protein
MKKRIRAVAQVNTKIAKESFISDHKAKPEDFTRNRKLSFTVIFIHLLRKTVKSLQVSLNELFMTNVIDSQVSASAYSQARNKFKHTAFIELNEDMIDIFYSDDEDIKKWNNYRCIAGDGSKIILPYTAEIEKEYGSYIIKNQAIEDKYSCALFECYYDVLNHMAIKSVLTYGPTYEVDAAIQMLDVVTESDLLIYDKGYASYEFLATLVNRGKNYLIRCPASSFKAAELLTKDTENWSKTVVLVPSKAQKKNIIEKQLPEKITVRFISVILSTGEVEILITSLLNPLIERDEFKWLYGMRWGVETFFSQIKGRLCLENFTGKTPEAVKQDFWSTIFISNFGTLMIEGLEDEMNIDLKEGQYRKKINGAISFNTIKNMAFDIFLNDTDKTKSLEKMIELFKTTPIPERPGRSAPRKKPSFIRSLNYAKRVKKMIF